MGKRGYLAGRTSSFVWKVSGKVKHTGRNYLYCEEKLRSSIFEEEYQRMQTCVSLVEGHYKWYKTGDRSRCSHYWISQGYVLVDPSQIRIPGFDAEMRREMTSDGNHQVALFRKRESDEYVVSVRGTKNLKDLSTDILSLGEVLHESSRVAILKRIVEALVNSVGAQNVILTGHSLGAGVAMIVGQELQRENRRRMTEFYFNPPYGSFQRLVSEVLSKIAFEMCAAKNTIYFLGLSGVQAKLYEILKRMGAKSLGYDLNGAQRWKGFWNCEIGILTFVST